MMQPATRAFTLTSDQMAAILAALGFWIALSGKSLQVQGKDEDVSLTEPERMVSAFEALRSQLLAYGLPSPEIPDIGSGV